MKVTGISCNFMKFTTFWLNGGLYAPMVENIDIPKGFLVVLEAPWTGKCGKSHNFSIFMKMWKFTKFRYFTRKTCFCGISAFLAARAPQNHQYPLRNVNDFNHGGARAPILPNSVELHGI